MNTTDSSKKIHCPHCRSYNFFESTQYRGYWTCRDCGTKFRDIDDLEKEIEDNKNSPAFVLVLTVICAIATIILLSLEAKAVLGADGDSAKWFDMDMERLPYGYFAIVSAICTAFSLWGYKWTKSNNKKRCEELQYLKTNCFN